MSERDAHIHGRLRRLARSLLWQGLAATAALVLVGCVRWEGCRSHNGIGGSLSLALALALAIAVPWLGRLDSCLPSE